MIDNHKNTRRKFIKMGFAITGTSAVSTNALSYHLLIDDSSNYSDTDKIPLNNVLRDYEQVNNKFGFGLKKVDIDQKEDWENKRKSILRRSKIMLGQPPVIKSEFEPPLSILENNQRDNYKELKVRFLSGTGDTIKGYLLVPNDTDKSSPRPAIVAMHSTGPGASQTVGLTPKENRMYGKELAERGYVVLAIDVISAGDRVYAGYDPYYTKKFYDEYPQWSAMDKMVSDHKTGVDYLCSLDFVDADRIGCVGHSLGGYNAFFLQAFDPRIKAVVCSCGLSPMGGTNSPYQFARNEWFAHFNPISRDFIRSGMIPCDMHEFMALCAPRHLFNYSAKQDTIYCPVKYQNSNGFSSWWKTVDESLSQISKVYKLMGRPKHFVRSEGNGDHDFPVHIRNEAYEWLAKVL